MKISVLDISYYSRGWGKNMNSNEDDSENMFFSYFSSSFKLFFAVVSFNILSRAAHETKTLYQKGSHPWEKPFPSYIFFIIFIRMICSLCTISKHLALKNTKHDALKLIHWEAWCCSLAGSAYQVWEAFTSPSSVVEPAVACLTGTNVPCLGRANRTGNLGVWTHFRNHKSADLPLLQGAEFTARCHLLPGSRRGSRRSTIQLAEGGHLLLPPNSDHLAPLQGWGGWRVMIEHSWGFSRSFSFFSRNFMARLLCSRSKFFSQKLFSPSCISSHGWGRWFLLLLGWGRQGSLPPGFHGEGEVVPNCQREGEGRTLASQHLAKVQALGCKWHIFRCCSHFHSLFLS